MWRLDFRFRPEAVAGERQLSGNPNMASHSELVVYTSLLPLALRSSQLVSHYLQTPRMSRASICFTQMAMRSGRTPEPSHFVHERFQSSKLLMQKRRLPRTSC